MGVVFAGPAGYNTLLMEGPNNSNTIVSRTYSGTHQNPVAAVGGTLRIQGENFVTGTGFRANSALIVGGCGSQATMTENRGRIRGEIAAGDLMTNAAPGFIYCSRTDAAYSAPFNTAAWVTTNLTDWKAFRVGYQNARDSDDTVNYEMGYLGFYNGSTIWNVGTLAGGTGTARDMALTPATNNVRFGPADAAAAAAFSSTMNSVLAGTTNTAGADQTINLSQGTGTGIGGGLVVKGALAGTTGSSVNALATWFQIDGKSNFVIGPQAALSTSATDGFAYAPSQAGAPTGAPTAFTGKIPFTFDSTNNKLYARLNGGWKSVTLA
jgi:hypothetical protein